MSSYTTQLKTYIEKWTQYEDGLSIRDKIEIGRTKLFDFEYPLFSEEYRKDFETHFIREFYTREIGFEVEELFKFKLETWLLINMPYYNKLFESELMEYDPLLNIEMNVSHTKTNDTNQIDSRTSTGTQSTDGSSDVTTKQHGNSELTTNQQGNSESIDDDFNRQLDSSTPDSRLNISANDGEGIIEYASNITEKNTNNKNTTKGESTRNETGTSQSTGSEIGTSQSNSEVSQNESMNSDKDEVEEFNQQRKGKIGVQSYAELLQKHRQALLRIEKDLFYEMNELFMLVY